MKKRSEILKQYYVSQTDIRRLLKVPYAKAKILYGIADEKEQSQFRCFDNKVSLVEVLKIANVNYSFLRKQIESEENRCQ